MANNNETKYYKIIGEASCFRHVYNIEDISSIQYGSVYIAQSPDMTQPYFGIKRPVIHFAEGAFDAMLWQTLLIWDFDKHTIYEIQPLTSVIKEPCMESGGVYQCGAQKIQILSQVDLDEMFDRAIAEFHQNRELQIAKYPYLDISKIMAEFVRHEQSMYLKNR